MLPGDAKGYGREEGNHKGSYSLRVSANYRLIVNQKEQDLSVDSLKHCGTLIIEGMQKKTIQLDYPVIILFIRERHLQRSFRTEN